VNNTGDYKTMELNFQRTIPASPAEVYDAWLDPQNSANPWHNSRRLEFNPKQGGLYHFMHVKDADKGEMPHYGRFVELSRPHRIQLAWMSLFTRGLESTVTVTFEPKGEDTLLTLKHANLPDDSYGNGHKHWEVLLGKMVEHFPARRASKAS
jgi:uncharacterized protein YndB with AHSA1/START domain